MPKPKLPDVCVAIRVAIHHKYRIGVQQWQCQFKGTCSSEWGRLLGIVKSERLIPFTEYHSNLIAQVSCAQHDLSRASRKELIKQIGEKGSFSNVGKRLRTA